MTDEDKIDALTLGDQLILSVGNRRALVMATSEQGIHTGRRRYLVVCLDCRALVHVATTGPLSMLAGHEYECRKPDGAR